MMRKLMSLVRDEEGIQHAEEAILLALIAIAAVTATRALATGITGSFNNAAACENNVAASCP